MVSNWRTNVWRYIGCTQAHWELPLGQSQTFVYLCAELVTPLLWVGKLWTHVLKMKTPGSAYNAALARFHGGSNVLNEVFQYFDLRRFPFGLNVLPD